MNNGIKNKLKELMGKEVDIDFGGHLRCPPVIVNEFSSKVLRFEDEDCVVFGNDKVEHLFSIDSIHTITFIKK